jgi:hypothetical protein
VPHGLVTRTANQLLAAGVRASRQQTELLAIRAEVECIYERLEQMLGTLEPATHDPKLDLTVEIGE